MSRPRKAAAKGKLATYDYLAKLEFEAMPGLKAEAIPTPEKFREQCQNTWQAMHFAVSAMEKGPDELAAIAKQEPEGTDQLLRFLKGQQERAEHFALLFETAAFRVLAGGCRAGLK